MWPKIFTYAPTFIALAAPGCRTPISFSVKTRRSTIDNLAPNHATSRTSQNMLLHVVGQSMLLHVVSQSMLLHVVSQSMLLHVVSQSMLHSTSSKSGHKDTVQSNFAERLLL